MTLWKNEELHIMRSFYFCRIVCCRCSILAALVENKFHIRLTMLYLIYEIHVYCNNQLTCPMLSRVFDISTPHLTVMSIVKVSFSTFSLVFCFVYLLIMTSKYAPHHRLSPSILKYRLSLHCLMYIHMTN